jgi:hypothetical protein
MTRAEIERCLRKAPWPEPSPDVRARVLSAAQVSDARVTWADRVWFSRACRLAAAGVAAGAIGAAWLTDAPATPFGPTVSASVEARAIDDISREIGLPADTAAAMAGRSLRTDTGAPSTDDQRLAVAALDIEGAR